MDWQELSPLIISSASAIITALVAAVVAWLNASKAKASYKEKLAEAEKANAELKTAIIESAFIVCPKCGEKIILKDTKINYKEN